MSCINLSRNNEHVKAVITFSDHNVIIGFGMARGMKIDNDKSLIWS